MHYSSRFLVEWSRPTMRRWLESSGRSYFILKEPMEGRQQIGVSPEQISGGSYGLLTSEGARAHNQELKSSYRPITAPQWQN